MDWGLRLSFAGLPFGETPEHAYVNGFELGQLWRRVTSGVEAEIAETMHAENAEAVRRMAAAEGWTVEIVPALADGKPVEGWVEIAMTKVASARPNPHGLRVV